MTIPTKNIQTSEQILLNDLSQLIEQSKNFVIVQANSVMTMLFWSVGKRINEDILQNKRADYGKQIVSPLAAQSPNRKIVQQISSFVGYFLV